MMWKHAVRCRLLIKIVNVLFMVMFGTVAVRMAFDWIPITNMSKPKTAGNASNQIFLLYFMWYGSHEIRQVWFTTCQVGKYVIVLISVQRIRIWSHLEFYPSNLHSTCSSNLDPRRRKNRSSMFLIKVAQLPSARRSWSSEKGNFWTSHLHIFSLSISHKWQRWLRS